MKSNSINNNMDLLISQNINENAAKVQKIIFPNNNKKIEVFIKREDLLHQAISGNKWRKLKYNLLYAKTYGYKTLLTFGGAFSNHIYATASAAKIFGFKSIGVIRGEEHLPLNPTLKFAISEGMHLHYVNRSNYRKKKDESFISELKNKFGEFYLIPEGGTNQLAIKGCEEIIEEINIEYDYICSACGTGGTLSGLICGVDDNAKVIGIPVLKGAEFLKNDIEELTYIYAQKSFSNWELMLDYHFGGYAKISKELVDFTLEFEELNGIKLDPVYTGKLLFGIDSLIKKKHFKRNTKIIVLHTGGLQGSAGMQNKINKLLS